MIFCTDCTSVLEEVSPLPYQPSLGVNMYLNNYPTADHNQQQMVHKSLNDQHQLLAAAAGQQRALTTTLQQASCSKQPIMNMYQQELTATSSFSGDKCSSSLMESMSLPPGGSIHCGGDSTLGELAQFYQQPAPILGNQVKKVLMI